MTTHILKPGPIDDLRLRCGKTPKQAGKGAPDLRAVVATVDTLRAQLAESERNHNAMIDDLQRVRQGKESEREREIRENLAAWHGLDEEEARELLGEIDTLRGQLAEAERDNDDLHHDIVIAALRDQLASAEAARDRAHDALRHEERAHLATMAEHDEARADLATAREQLGAVREDALVLVEREEASLRNLVLGMTQKQYDERRARVMRLRSALTAPTAPTGKETSKP